MEGSREKFVNELIRRCSFLHDRQSFIDLLLKPMKEFFSFDGVAVSGMKGIGCDPGFIHIGYPTQFLMDFVNMRQEQRPYLAERLEKWMQRGYGIFAASDFNYKENYPDEYRERYAPYGIKDAMQSTLLDSRDSIMGFTGAMTSTKEAFTEQDKTFLDIITPYLFYAYRRYKWLLNIEFFTALSPEDLIFGVVTADKDGRVTYMNAAARGVIERHAGGMSATLPLCLQSSLEKLVNDCRYTGNVSLIFREVETDCPYGSVVCFNYDEYGLKYLPGECESEGVAFIINARDIDKVLTASLTKREREVIGCLVRGMKDKDIAEALYISEKTVHNHVSNILEKLEASNRTEASSKAVKLGVV